MSLLDAIDIASNRLKNGFDLAGGGLSQDAGTGFNLGGPPQATGFNMGLGPNVAGFNLGITNGGSPGFNLSGIGNIFSGLGSTLNGLGSAFSAGFNFPNPFAPPPKPPGTGSTVGGTTIPGDATGLKQWEPLINQEAQKAGIPSILYAAAIGAESGGDRFRAGDNGQSHGLFQAYSGGRGAGHTQQELWDPALQFQLAAPEFKSAWDQAQNLQFGSEQDRMIWAIMAAQRPVGWQGNGAIDWGGPSVQNYRNWIDRLQNAQVQGGTDPTAQTLEQRGAAPPPGSIMENLRQQAGLLPQAVGQAANQLGSTTTSIAGSVLQEANKWLGTPYVWGGQTQQGADCSGFVWSVMNSLGIAPTPGRTDAESIRQATIPVAPNQAQPGDLAFYRDDPGVGGAGHMGIFQGNGQMIDANFGRGNVGVTDITAPYYTSRFIEYRRPRAY